MEPQENLSRRELDQFRGRLINQVGEGHELEVFNIFVRLIRQKNISPTLLILRKFEMDTNNPLSCWVPAGPNEVTVVGGSISLTQLDEDSTA